MANTHAERGTVIPDFHIKLPHKNTVLKTVAYITGGAMLAGGIGYGVDRYIKSQNDNNIDPNNGIAPITTEGTMPSQETTIPTTEGEIIIPTTQETAKPTETTPTPTETEVIKIEAYDLTSYGLKYNIETEKYETMDNRYGIETKEAGGFYENFYVEDVKTGIYYLNSKILEVLMENQEGDYKMAFPLGFSDETKGNIKVDSIFAVKQEVECIRISFDNQMNFVNSIYSADTFQSASKAAPPISFKFQGTDFLFDCMGIRDTTPILGKTPEESKKAYYVSVLLPSGTAQFNSVYNTEFGQPIIPVQKSPIIVVGTKEGKAMPTTSKNFFSINGKFVGIQEP